MDVDVGSTGSTNRLLAGLAPADLALLMPRSTAANFDQRTILQEAGDLLDTVYFPLSGMISLLAIMQSGSAVETATVGREGAVGILAAFGGRTATVRAVVQVAGRFLRMSARAFEAAAAQSAGIRDMSVRYLEEHVTLVHQVAGCNALHPMEARLCRWLLQTRDRIETEKLPLTHEFLSEMLGAQRSTVSMMARRLQDAALIRYAHGHIDVVDRAGLERKACECYAIVREKTRFDGDL